VNDVTWFKPNAAPNFTGRMMTESTERALWFCPSGSRWTYNRLWAKAQNNGKGYRDVWTFNAMGHDRYHPTQKPVALIERFIGLISNPGDLVCDPFMGSGTTAVAARNLGRRFIGCDLSREYVMTARRRVQNTDPYRATVHTNGVLQPSLFGGAMAQAGGD
jgi:DNA modification methylase